MKDLLISCNIEGKDPLEQAQKSALW